MPDSHNQKSMGELVIFQTEDLKTRVQVRLQDESVWMTQFAMAELFQTTIANINIHVKNIYEEGELDEFSTIKDYLIVQTEGKRDVKRKVKHYNLEAILAVGYRVRSHRGTQFRKWATERLNEYLVKGFTMDDERLKQGTSIGSDYFDELLERIRDIRASEKRFYQKIRDIYRLAVDYNPNSEETVAFFKIVQNKLHFAITGRTAAELIAERVDASKPNMGLTSWSGGKIRRADVTVAKNYLNSNELEDLNRIVVMYLDYAENQTRRREVIYMKDWREKLDAFLKFNECDILEHSGKVSKEIADALALENYEKFNSERISSEAEREALDDDKELKHLQDEIEKSKE